MSQVVSQVVPRVVFQVVTGKSFYPKNVVTGKYEVVTGKW